MRRWGGAILILAKNRSLFLFVCHKIGLSLFGVCLFFGGFWCIEKLGLPPKKKLLAGRLGLDPLSKTHSTYSGHRESTHIYPHTKLSTGLTIGTGTPLHHLVAKQSFTKHRRYADHGHREEQMHGIWVHQRTTIDAICTAYRRRVLTESRAQLNSSPNTAKSQI